MGVAHGEAYKKAGANIVGVFDLNADAAHAFSERFNAKIFRSQDDLVKGDIDALSICLPHSLHYEAGLLAASHGKHTLIEKPIDTSGKAGRQIVRAFREADVCLMVGFVTRFYRSQIYLKNLIDSGYFGEIRLVVENLAAGGFSLPEWYSQKDKAGGGILMMGISHTVDRVGWLLDDKVSSVFAQKHPDTLQGNVEDIAAAVMNYSQGAVLSVSACRSALREHKRSHSCFIYGTRAQAKIEFGENHEQTLEVLGENGSELQSISDDDPF